MSLATRRSALAAAVMMLMSSMHPALAYHGGGHGGGVRPSYGGGGGGEFRGAGAGGRAEGFNGGAARVAPRNEGAVGNRDNFSGNRVNNVNNFGNVNRGGNTFNNANVNRHAGGPAGWHNPYYGNHAGFVHGYWGGHYANGWGWRPYGYGGYGYGLGGLGWGLGTGLGIGFGSGLGWGLSSWLYGPSLYNWGYSNYSNPYYGGYGGGVGVAQGGGGYDYGQPINLQASMPDEATTTQANTTFDQARDAFKQGNYAQALDLTDQSLKQSPNDTTLHEFRGLCLFALGRYDESAASLYAVLTAGPGWDWTTLIGLYGDPAVYTQQLRALEAYVDSNQQSAGARFVLAYQYLTDGYAEQAVDQFKVVEKLQPKDQIASQMVKQLQKVPDSGATGSADGTVAATDAVPSPPVDAATASAAPPLKQGTLDGGWTAQANGGTTITVNYADGKTFSWKVSQQGKDRTIAGKYSYVNGILTMVQDQASTMVGEVNFTDDTHFTFKVLGGGPEDPGLTFTKAQ